MTTGVGFYAVACLLGVGAGAIVGALLNFFNFQHLTGPNPKPDEGPPLSLRQVRQYRMAAIIITTALFIGAGWWRGGFSAALVRDWMMIFTMVPVMMSDWICYRINDAFCILGLIAGIVSATFVPWLSVKGAILGALGYIAVLAVIYVVSIPIYKRPAMADGDLAFALPSGAFLGWGPTLALGFSLACAIGGLVETLLLLIMKLRGKDRPRSPFGTYMAIGTLVVVLLFG